MSDFDLQKNMCYFRLEKENIILKISLFFFNFKKQSRIWETKHFSTDAEG